MLGGSEVPEFLERVPDEDHFGDGLGFPFIDLHHQKALAIGRNIPTAVRRLIE